MDVEITPEPTDAEHKAIQVALEVEAPPASGPWIEPLGDDQEP